MEILQKVPVTSAMPDIVNVMLGIGFLVGGGWLLARRGVKSNRRAISEAAGAVPPTGAQRVMDADQLLRPHAALTDEIIRIVGLHRADWTRMGDPLLVGFARFCQRMPASEAHHHAHPGGLLEHSLDVATRALRLRQGLMLPHGGDAEDIARLKSRWSYAVLAAALLHDIGKPISDLDITCGNARGEGSWYPLAGSLPEQGMDWYRVKFVKGRGYELHQRLAVLLLQKLIPAEAIAWLSAPGGPMSELMAYLSGEAKAGALVDLVTRADRQSVAANLMTGPRVRFACARDVPLIERLMAGLRGMLASGLMPLNRDGAGGFVAEGCIWLVCKRIADELREYLEKNELAAPDGAPGLPSSFKNDRIFDTFQEYGALTPNPATGGAVWTVQVSDAGWSHTLTVLRFPLEILYPRDRIPNAFVGAITVVEKKTMAPTRTPPVAEIDNDQNGFSSPPTAEEPMAATAPASSTNAAQEEFPEPPRVPPAFDALAGLRALIDGEETTETANPTPQHAKVGSRTPILPDEADGEFLDDHDASMEADDGRTKTSQNATPAKAPKAGRSATAIKQPKIPSPQVLAPVAPHTPPPPSTTGTTGNIPEDAMRLMAWIQEGLGNGTLVYNVPGALVHFVDEGGEILMLLVSPRIFRHHLESIGAGATGEPEDKIGAALQKAFFRAGWHRAGPKKTNIQRYRVRRRNSEDGSLLSVVVIPHPERFVNPLPPPNPHIAPFFSPVDDSSSKPIKRVKE